MLLTYAYMHLQGIGCMPTIILRLFYSWGSDAPVDFAEKPADHGMSFGDAWSAGSQKVSIKIIGLPRRQIAVADLNALSLR